MRKQTKQKSLTLGACFSFHLIRIKAHSIFCALCPHSSYFVGLNRQIAIKKPNTHDSNCEKQANYSSNNKYNKKKKKKTPTTTEEESKIKKSVRVSLITHIVFGFVRVTQ